MYNLLEFIQRETIPVNSKVLHLLSRGEFTGIFIINNLLQKFKPEAITLIIDGEEQLIKMQSAFPSCKIVSYHLPEDFKNERFDLICVDFNSLWNPVMCDEILKGLNKILSDKGCVLLYTISDMSFVNMLNGNETTTENIIRKDLIEEYGINKAPSFKKIEKYFIKNEKYQLIDYVEKNNIIQYALIKPKPFIEKVMVDRISHEQNITESYILKQNKKILTVAIPAWNSGNIAWLAMESLCAQQQIDFDWELLIIEENNENANPFTVESFMQYEEALKKVRCINIKYITLKKRITLTEKWKRMGEIASNNSIAFLLQSCDCYSYPTRLKMSYDAAINGYDWFQCKQGCFYEVQTGIVIKYNGDTIEWAKNHLNMGFRTEYAKIIPFAELPSGIDGWLVKIFEEFKGSPLEIYNDPSDNWKYGVDSHGVNNISKNRGRHFVNPTPPFEATNIKIEEILPDYIVQRLLSLKNKE